MEEKFEGYKMTFKFNASHSLSDETKKHAHTFLVRLYIQKDTKDFVEFFEYEKLIKNYINQYRGQYLNDYMQEIPTIENVCIMFFEDIEKIFNNEPAFSLISLEFGDNPLKMAKVGHKAISSRANIIIDDIYCESDLKGLGL